MEALGRRGFLRGLGLLAGGLVLDPEKLLWVPGRKTIFVPAWDPRYLHISDLRYFQHMLMQQLENKFVFHDFLSDGDFLPARTGKTVKWYGYSA